MLFDELTEEQKQAATAAGSVAVTAGAGTGKTKMLAARYLFHVHEQGHSPLSVIAVTFTEKAADELRSRIRASLLAEVADPETVAEVEAAQISTIHSLAARICRDFYDIAGIPSDFSVLDDLDSPIWLAQEFEAAIAGVPRETVAELGYDWLKNALRELLADPSTAADALSVEAETWRSLIESSASEAVQNFLSSAEFADASLAVNDFEGPPEDRLEEARQAAVLAMREIIGGGDTASAFENLSTMQAHLGSAKNWPAGGKERLGGSLRALKLLAREVKTLATLSFGPEDEEAAVRVSLLREAFESVSEHLSQAKLQERVLDFNDLERYALKILRDPGGHALRHYSERWKAFLVDEFQDTNPVQAEIIELLTRECSLTIVGDEKQAIYGFRGADPDVFARFRSAIVDGRRGEEIGLSRTFRTHSELVAEMNALFEPVLGPLHQDLSSEIAAPQSPGPPYTEFSFVCKPDSKTPVEDLRSAEAEFAAEKIVELIAGGCEVFDPSLGGNRSLEYRDIVVLSRAWSVLDTFADTFASYGIPSVHAGGGSLLKTREAEDALSMLSFLVEPHDDIHLVALLRSPFFAVSDVELFEMAARNTGRSSWWELIRSANGRIGAARDKLLELMAGRDREASLILATADRLTGYSAVAANLPGGTRRSADWQGTMGLIRRLERTGNGGLFGTVRHLQQLVANEVEIARPQLESEQAVSLMTIHRSKGLEWPVVFVVDLARRKPPSLRRMSLDRDLGVTFKLETDTHEKAEPAIYRLAKIRSDEREARETRRLLYVAITRARDKVVLTSSGEKGGSLDILIPGLRSAGVPMSEVVPPESTEPKRHLHEVATGEQEAQVLIDAVRVGPRVLTPTGLETYSRCPKQFHFAHVMGHPGLGEGPAVQSTLGSLTHKALELDIVDTATLARFSKGCGTRLIETALSFAESFRTHPTFAAIDREGALREAPFRLETNGVVITGIADMVGGDFVLDFKTTAEAEPGRYHLQMWAYAAAFEKPRAMIAFLRQNSLVELSQSDLAEAAGRAQQLIADMRAAKYPAKPSVPSCSSCLFSAVCPDSAVSQNPT